MKFGIVPINLREFTDPEMVIPFVQKAEAFGYESVWTAEHVIIPKQYDSVQTRRADHRPLGCPDLHRLGHHDTPAGHRGQYSAPDEPALFGQMGLVD